jgi:thiaminase/transcriptional activator TenA
MRSPRPIPALALAAALGIPSAASAEPFSQTLWQRSLPVYRAILEHPFLEGLTDGALPRERFVFYLIQDAAYLRDFARALEVVADKAPRDEWATLLRTHARETLAEELKMQQEIFERFGVPEQEQRAQPRAPDAFAYTRFLLAAVHEGSFAEGMAALLPCYWIYWEVGRELARKGSPEPGYQQWIDAYSSEAYGETVREVIGIVDAAARAASPEERERMREAFLLGSRYEWMFWNAAWEMQGWPPEGAAGESPGARR